MVAGSITEEIAVAVPAELLWKVAFGATGSTIIPKACAGYIEAVEIDGNGGPGSITTMKLHPSLAETINIKEFKSRVVASDDAARVFKTEVLEGGKGTTELKTHEVEVKVDAAGDGASVAKVKVVYERHDGAKLAPEEEAELAQGYVRLVTNVAAYITAHPNEFA